jgi:flagellar protein FliO/FliZ
MQFITSLFGGSGNTWLNILFALGIVVVLIVIVVWLLRALFGATSGVTRGRNRRLAVVDTLALDPKRQLLIVRRDDVEHLVLVGGPQDLVIETGIPVIEAEAAPQPSRRPIPMAAARKGRQAPPVAAVEPEPARPKATPRSLRDTGLLRSQDAVVVPVSPEFSPQPAPLADDSAKEASAQQRVEGVDRATSDQDPHRI